MMWREVKGLKDAWRGTPLPRSINQNDGNQIQVTKHSIQCVNDRPNLIFRIFAGPSVS